VSEPDGYLWRFTNSNGTLGGWHVESTWKQTSTATVERRPFYFGPVETISEAPYNPNNEMLVTADQISAVLDRARSAGAYERGEMVRVLRLYADPDNWSDEGQFMDPTNALQAPRWAEADFDIISPKVDHGDLARALMDRLEGKG